MNTLEAVEQIEPKTIFDRKVEKGVGTASRVQIIPRATTPHPLYKLRNPCTNGYAAEAKYNAAVRSSLFPPLFYFSWQRGGPTKEGFVAKRSSAVDKTLPPYPCPLPFTCLFVRFVKLLAHYGSAYAFGSSIDVMPFLRAHISPTLCSFHACV